MVSPWSVVHLIVLPSLARHIHPPGSMGLGHLGEVQMRSDVDIGKA
jgi:hypothetical protein